MISLAKRKFGAPQDSNLRHTRPVKVRQTLRRIERDLDELEIQRPSGDLRGETFGPRSRGSEVITSAPGRSANGPPETVAQPRPYRNQYG